MLRRLIGKLGGPALRALPAPGPRLIPAATLLPGFREGGGGPEAARTLTFVQLDALEVLVASDSDWAHLCELVARTGDPWNAGDWPDGFDPLMLCAALCDDVAFECTRCPVGQRQGGWSCAHPQSLFGYVLTLLRRGERSALRTHIQDMRAVLGSTARWDLHALQRRDD